MADEIDKGQEAEEMFRALALRSVKPDAQEFESGTGLCLWCEEPTGSAAKRWCCAECRDFSTRRREAQRRAGQE